ncbi:MAG: rane protein [Flaviaesturariibacter sp.]|nr:rane protein [Flaviaesturariibacter sp.]
MEITLYHLLLLCVASFFAGFVDAIVGGGGLIQTPASLIILGGFPVASVIATVKIPSFSGTLFAAQQYVKKVKIRWKLIAIICTVSFFASYAGSQLLLYVSNAFMKPVLLVVLTAVAIYTFRKKDFGQKTVAEGQPDREWQKAAIISLIIGFYDGFIGPGTGSFFILAFITFLHLDFLQASAHAKLANLATNLGSITLFLLRGKIIWMAAIPMAISNALGGAIGARLAIAKGNRFIRIFFLIVVIGTLLRFMYDVFLKA